MKKKVLSLILSTAMVASLAACGSTSADTTATTDASDTQAADTTSSDATATTTESDTAAAADESYTLETLNIVVDGTLTATVESGQDAFKAQW